MFMVLGTVKDLEMVSISNEKVRENLYEYLKALDDNYGNDRDIFESDGGFAVIINDENDLYEADDYVYLGDDSFEFIERVDDTYIQMLKLCNNEYSILVIINEAVCPRHLFNVLD